MKLFHDPACEYAEQLEELLRLPPQQFEETRRWVAASLLRSEEPVSLKLAAMLEDADAVRELEKTHDYQPEV